MLNFQWKIGVAISSNTCKSLFSPYVSIRFDLKNEEGVLVPHTAELTYDQFKVSHLPNSLHFNELPFLL
jgi:hypothetical protein